MGIYEFKEQDAYDFGRHVNIQTFRRGDELHFKTCPYCKSQKDKDTFAINLKKGTFNCKRASCGVTGNMVSLSRDFGFSLGTDVDEYYRPKKKYREFKTPAEPIKPKPAAIEYLESRGISKETAEKYEITTWLKNDKILVFPFYDENKKLQFIKYRKTDFDKEKDKNKEWCEEKGRPILFGMKQCNGKFDRLVICEGQLDSVSVATAGIENAVSVPTGANGFTWIPYCWNWVNLFDEIVVFGDYEKGHITLLDTIRRRFNKKKVLHVREEDYKSCKDANEILQKYGAEAVRHAVENAILVPIEKIVDAADVPPDNSATTPKLKTGVKWLDNFLYGGIPFGCVCILTGREGSGKSTLASQILVNAINEGHICLAYSGELRKERFIEWLALQIAGRHHIVENEYDTGDGEFTKNRFVTNKNMELIREWYREKLFLYDNDAYLDDEAEKIELLKLVEKAICQYNTNVILLDNLMTAMYEDNVRGNDRNIQQGNFMEKLRRLSVKYNVIVLLVAHMRKGYIGDSSENEPNDEISGTADLKNMAGVILGLSKGTKKEIEEGKVGENQRRLTVGKNRLFGRTTTKGILLNYDEVSRRLFWGTDNLDKEFGWLAPVEFKLAESDDIKFD